MPVIKNALLRFRVIDRCLRNPAKPYPDKEFIRRACEEELFGSSAGDNICNSTIEKDMFAMKMEHDAPIKFSRRENGYYYANPEFTMEDVPLTPTDIEAIKAATAILGQFKQTHLFKQFEFAIDKILDRVNISSNVQDEAIDQYVQFESVTVVGGSEYLQPILEAIKNKQKVQFYYQSFKSKERKIRRVHPYLLKEYRNRWYLIGKSELKDSIVTFALDRMDSFSLLEQRYDQKDFSAQTYFNHAIGITSNTGEPEKITIRTNEVLSKYLISQPLHPSQKLEKQEGEAYYFSYFLLNTIELRMQLMSFADEVKVISPPALRQQLLNSYRSVLKQYENE